MSWFRPAAGATVDKNYWFSFRIAALFEIDLVKIGYLKMTRSIGLDCRIESWLSHHRRVRIPHTSVNGPA